MTALSSIDEKELVLLLSIGDRKAFDQIYHLYKRRIYASLMKLVKSEDLAKELLQEVFVKLWFNHTKLDRVDFFAAYLYRLTANMVADYFRKAAFDKKLQDRLGRSMTELYDHVEEYINYKESNIILQHAINSLPPQRQTIYKLCKIDGKTYEEASRILGISTSTIHDHIVKASKSIRTHLIKSQEATSLIILSYLLLHA